MSSGTAATGCEASACGRRCTTILLLIVAAFACLELGSALTGDWFVSTEVVRQSVQPWSGLEAPPPVHNGNLADQPTIWLGMQWATRQMIRRGEWPLYTFESYAGAPWLGNMSSALFSPFTWLFILLPFGPAFAICAALKWLLAGLGAFKLARALGLSGPAAILPGVAYAFCGFQVVWIDSCLTNVSVWAPWLLLAIERVLERPRAGRAALLALVAWQVLVGGHPETSLYVGLGAVVYAACRWIAGVRTDDPLLQPEGVLEAPAQERRGSARTCQLTVLSGSGLVAALLAAVQWWPFLEYALSSFGQELRVHSPDLFRSSGDRSPWSWLAVALPIIIVGRIWVIRGGPKSRAGRVIVPIFVAAVCLGCGVIMRRCGLRPTLLLQWLPDYYGRSLDGGSYGGPFTYNDVTAGYVGGALFIAAVAAAFARLRDARVFALALAGFVVAIRFFRVPGLAETFERVPVLATTGSTRALGFVALALAMLGGFAVEELIERPRRLVAVAIGFLLLLLGVGIASDDRFLVHAPTVSARTDGARLELPDNLADGGPSGFGAEVRGLAPADAQRVRLSINGVLKAELVPEAAAADGLKPFHWQWLGSHRIEEGGYRILAEAVRADGSSDRFAVELGQAKRPARWSVRWLLPLAITAALLLCALVPYAWARVVVLLAGTAAELLFFGVTYNATTPPDRVPGAVEPIPFLQQKEKEVGPFRLFTARTAIHPNLHYLFDLEVTRGYDALEPLSYVKTLRQLDRGGQEVLWTLRDFSTLDLESTASRQLLDFLNIRYLLSSETPPAGAGLHEVWRRSDGLALFENPAALPRAFCVQRGGDAMALHRDLLRGVPGADLRSTAAWEPDAVRRTATSELGDAVAIPGQGRVIAFDHARGRMGATIESEKGTILIVTENAAGFRARINGAPAEIRRTHGTFMSVVVPAGRHRVELDYRPDAVVRGAWLALAGAAALAALGLAAVRRSRRP